MYRNPRYNPTAYDDDWEDQPGQGPFYQWGLGSLLPAGMLLYGVSILYTHAGTFGTRNSMVLHGHCADAYGVAVIAAAIFVHCHYFWGNIYNEAWFAVLGKILAAMAFIAAVVFLLIRLGIYGRNA